MSGAAEPMARAPRGRIGVRIVAAGRAALVAATFAMYAGGWALAAESVYDAAEQTVRASFSGATEEEWRTRMAQDQAQSLCSRHRNKLPAELAQGLMQAQAEGIRYPADGRLMGDWREGEKLASIGTGGHIGRIQPDPPGRKRGGNCYACHLLAPKEVAAGTIGPSLTDYAKLRGTSSESIKYTYDKIYNAQAFAACSLMPRFGHNGWLTPEEIAHTVAFLLDPQSPVNRPAQGAAAAAPAQPDAPVKQAPAAR